MSGRMANAIIAGTNKAGTTSLFRYLSDHPQVCGSRVKETGFFRRRAAPISPEERILYAEFFEHCPADVPVILEATPSYLAGARRTAEALRDVVPRARLLFVLREPASRLLSDWKRRGQRMQKELEGLSGEEYVDRLVAADDISDAADPFFALMRSVDYAGLLRQYLDVFPPEQLGVWFFDQLKSDVRSFMESVCVFLDIDATFYRGYDFRVENRTRSYRSRWLHRLAFKTNMALEDAMNRAPRFRNLLRSGYHLVNASKSGSRTEVPEYADRLRSYFLPRTRTLGTLLREVYPGIQLPDWISLSGEDDPHSKTAFENPAGIAGRP